MLHSVSDNAAKAKQKSTADQLWGRYISILFLQINKQNQKSLLNQSVERKTWHVDSGTIWELSILVQAASGPSLSSTWCVSHMASATASPPSSIGLMGAARLRKSWRSLNEMVTSASSSFWGITLMKKPILLDFLKATTLQGEKGVMLGVNMQIFNSFTVYVHVCVQVLTNSGSSWKSCGSASSSYSAAASFPAKTSSLLGTRI